MTDNTYAKDTVTRRRMYLFGVVDRTLAQVRHLEDEYEWLEKVWMSGDHYFTLRELSCRMNICRIKTEQALRYADKYAKLILQEFYRQETKETAQS